MLARLYSSLRHAQIMPRRPLTDGRTYDSGVIQDGSSFAIHKALAHVFPGRFNAIKPAAVELHCTLDLLQDAPITISLSPDTDSERAYLPEPNSLKGDLLLSDRGYLDLA